MYCIQNLWRHIAHGCDSVQNTWEGAEYEGECADHHQPQWEEGHHLHQQRDSQDQSWARDNCATTTRQLFRDNETMFSGLKMVGYCPSWALNH